MRSLQVVAGLEPNQGGPAYSVPKLCEALATEGWDVALHSVAEVKQSEETRQLPNMTVTLHRWDGKNIPLIGGTRLSSAFSKSLRDCGRNFDIFHVHGLWTWPTVTAGDIAAHNSIPMVLSPRGMLSPNSLQISRKRKEIFWRLFHRQSLRSLSCLHATSALEVDELKRFSAKLGLKVPVAMVPNGIDLPDILPRRRSNSVRTILSLGRIHPKKGLDLLISAWSRIAARRPDWNLKIVGPDEGKHADLLRRLAAELQVPRISIDGPVFGADKTEAYRAADLFVLSSHAENFGLTVAEALAAEIPVIATKNTPWQALAEEQCGWWIDGGTDGLADALETATSQSSETLIQMGANGRAYIGRTFRWEIIGREMSQVYCWILGRGPKPSCVE